MVQAEFVSVFHNLMLNHIPVVVPELYATSPFPSSAFCLIVAPYQVIGNCLSSIDLSQCLISSCQSIDPSGECECEFREFSIQNLRKTHGIHVVCEMGIKSIKHANRKRLTELVV